MGRTAHHAAAAFDLSLSRSFARSSSRCCIGHRSLLVALELLGLSRLCSSRVLSVFSNIISLTGGFGGLGRHWRASLVSLSLSLSLSRLED